MFGVAFAPRGLVKISMGGAHAQVAVIDRSARIVIEGVVNIAVIVVGEPWEAVAAVCVCLFTC